MTISTYEARSVAEYAARVVECRATWKGGQASPLIWFRGHREAAWELVPSLLRPKYRALLPAERSALHEFRVTAPMILGEHPPMQEEWAWLAALQHFGYPTRLLDWTNRSLVGLFFATYDRPDESHDATVWVLRPEGWNDSAHGTGDLVVVEGKDRVDTVVGPRLRPAERTHEAPFAIAVPHTNNRIRFQSGFFTVHGRDQRPLDQFTYANCLARINIPAAFVRDVRKALLDDWLREVDVFPEPEWLCKQMLRTHLADLPPTP